MNRFPLPQLSWACPGVLSLLLLLISPACSHAQASQLDISGKWFGSFDVIAPDGNLQHNAAFFILKQAGDNLTGSVGATEDQQSQIKNGKVIGQNIQFVIEVHDSQLFFQLIMDGAHLKGTASSHDPQHEFNAKIDVTRVATQKQSMDSPDGELYAEIVQLDNALFKAFNERDLGTLSSFFDKNFEMYHDRDGMTGYEQNMDAFRKHFADETRLRRKLVDGTLEVYPLAGYGAVEICTQQFFTTEKGKPEFLSATSRMVNIWHKQDGKWTLTRSISYDHR